MANTSTTSAARPDVDIQADIDTAIAQYPPIVNDRHHVKVQVEAGAVTLSGHVKTTITTDYIKEKLAQIDGVKSVDVSQLYNDERLRLNIGQYIPVGVWANIEYGHVMLTGRLPEGTTPSSLVASISQMTGVRDVRTSFIA